LELLLTMASSTAHQALSAGTGKRLTMGERCCSAIVRKQLQLDASLYTCLQILSVSLFERKPSFHGLAAR